MPPKRTMSHLTIRLPDSLLSRLRADAGRLRIPLAEYVRQLVTVGLAAEDSSEQLAAMSRLSSQLDVLKESLAGVEQPSRAVQAPISQNTLNFICYHAALTATLIQKLMAGRGQQALIAQAVKEAQQALQRLHEEP